LSRREPIVLVNAVAARKGAGATALAPYVLKLAELCPTARFDVVVTADFRDRVPHDRITWLERAIPGGMSLRRLIWDQVQVAWMSRRYDALLSPMNFGPIFSCRPHVLLERNILYFEPNSGDTSHVTRMRLAFHKLLAIASMNAASQVLVPSEAMADAVRPFVWRRSKIQVARYGIDLPSSAAVAAEPLPDAAAEWQKADVRLVHVSSPTPHKDLRCVARTTAAVIAAMPNKSVRLAVTFHKTDSEPSVIAFCDDLSTLGILESVAFLGPVPRATALALYHRAQVTLFPSRCESFGRPVLESLAMGTQVVATNITSLKEVGGGYSLHHRPGDWEEAAELTLRTLLTPFSAGDRATMIDWLGQFTMEAEVSVGARALGLDCKSTTE
jgi:glycosyltransferase involved in cell wall biosynthesis